MPHPFRPCLDFRSDQDSRGSACPIRRTANAGPPAAAPASLRRGAWHGGMWCRCRRGHTKYGLPQDQTRCGNRSLGWRPKYLTPRNRRVRRSHARLGLCRHQKLACLCAACRSWLARQGTRRGNCDVINAHAGMDFHLTGNPEG